MTAEKHFKVFIQPIVFPFKNNSAALQSMFYLKYKKVGRISVFLKHGTSVTKLTDNIHSANFSCSTESFGLTMHMSKST